MRLADARRPSSHAEIGDTNTSPPCARSRSIAWRAGSARGWLSDTQISAQVSSSRAIHVVEIGGERRVGRLGQVAVKAANLLRGKEKAIFTPHVDTGDFVVVINADKPIN